MPEQMIHISRLNSTTSTNAPTSWPFGSSDLERMRRTWRLRLWLGRLFVGGQSGATVRRGSPRCPRTSPSIRCGGVGKRPSSARYRFGIPRRVSVSIWFEQPEAAPTTTGGDRSSLLRWAHGAGDRRGLGLQHRSRQAALRKGDRQAQAELRTDGAIGGEMIDSNEFDHHPQAHPTDDHRERVRNRAAELTRRRRLVVGAAGLGLALLVAGAASVSALSLNGPGPGKSQSVSTFGRTPRPNSASSMPGVTSPPTTTAPEEPTAPERGSPSGAPTSVPSSTPSSSGGPQPTTPSGGEASGQGTQPDSGSSSSDAGTPAATTTTSPPQSSSSGNSAGAVSAGRINTVIIHDQPSGTTIDAFADVGGRIDLGAPSVGSWGNAYVSSGDSTVVTVNYTTLNPDGECVRRPLHARFRCCGGYRSVCGRPLRGLDCDDRRRRGGPSL